jgi:hypothetical protein
MKLESAGDITKIAVSMKDLDGSNILIDRLDIGKSVDNEEFASIWYGAPQILLTLVLEKMGNNYLTTKDFSKLEQLKRNL